MPIQKPICILAGSREQYEQWLADNGHTSKTAVHCFRRDIAQACEFSAIEVVGTFWETKHPSELYHEALAHVR